MAVIDVFFKHLVRSEYLDMLDPLGGMGKPETVAYIAATGIGLGVVIHILDTQVETTESVELEADTGTIDDVGIIPEVVARKQVLVVVVQKIRLGEVAIATERVCTRFVSRPHTYRGEHHEGQRHSRPRIPSQDELMYRHCFCD